MAVSFVWPLTLPQRVRPDFGESVGKLILRTPMDAGPSKSRLRGTRPDKLKVTFDMSTAQVELLRTFVDSTIKGVARFGFPHPRTTEQVEVRIIPSDDGELFSISNNGPNWWIVTMNLEVMP